MIRDFIVEIGDNPADYLFDVPRMRVVPNYDYLHAGVSYAYKPHRDTWYGRCSASSIHGCRSSASAGSDDEINPAIFRCR